MAEGRRIFPARLARMHDTLLRHVDSSPLMRERLFEPLGMNDTGFTVPEAQPDRVATCYKTDFSSGEITVLEEARSEENHRR